MLFALLSLLVVLAKIGESTRVLVIGASGRLGKAVINQLVKKNIPVRALVRNDKTFSIPSGNNIETYIGDVSNPQSLLYATKGITSIIDCHGVRPLRFTRLSDLYSSPSRDPGHPYNVNYIGVRNILHAMKKNGVNKLVRITGGLISKGEYSLFKALFNLLLSFSVKWHELSEIAISESGVDYTVLRPTELMNIPPAKESNRTLIMRQAVDGMVVKAGKIPIVNVADLCVESVLRPELSYCTALITTEAGSKGPQEWSPLIKQMTKDTEPLKAKKHLKGVLFLGTILATAATLTTIAGAKLVGFLFDFAMRFLAK